MRASDARPRLGISNRGAPWKVYLEATPVNLFTWHVLAGLSILEDRGQVELAIRRSALGENRAPFWRMDVHDRESDRSRRVHVDLSDGPALAYSKSSGPTDVIFKRTLGPLRTGPHNVPVLPYGMIFECRSGAERTSWLLRHATSTLRGLVPPRTVRGAKLIRSTVRFARAAGTSRPDGLPMLLAQYEIDANEPAEPLIFYQTRVWDPGSGHDPTDREAVNEMRAQIVRALRSAFGEQYLGGLIATRHAVARYPDCITSLPSSRPAYLELLRRCAVVVSTAGLHGSLPFKLPEYLAASRAIVAERSETILPAPLVDGAQVLAFTTPEECVEKCGRLVSDPTLCASVRHCGWDYYRTEVRPDALLLNRLRDLRGLQHVSVF